MDLYHITLFVHLVTLLVAAGITAVTKLAAGRRERARTVGEVLDWHSTLLAAAKLFPICLVVFVITGGYMLRMTGVPWSTGFVAAGLTGVVFLFATGTFLGIKGGALKQMLENMAQKGADQPAPKLVPPPLIAALPLINTGVAFAVAFDMVTKPASISVALSIVAIGVVLGAVLGMRAAPAAQAVPTA